MELSTSPTPGCDDWRWRSVKAIKAVDKAVSHGLGGLLTHDAAVLPGLLQGVELLLGALQLLHQLRDLLPERGVLLLRGGIALHVTINAFFLFNLYFYHVNVSLRLRPNPISTPYSSPLPLTP